VKDMSKTKAQLIEELETLRVRNRTLEHSDAVRAQEPGRLELISRAAEQSTEGMAIVDLEGNLIFLNNSFANMHGYDPDELIGKNLSIFHTPDQMPSRRVCQISPLKVPVSRNSRFAAFTDGI